MTATEENTTVPRDEQDERNERDGQGGKPLEEPAEKKRTRLISGPGMLLVWLYGVMVVGAVSRSAVQISTSSTRRRWPTRCRRWPVWSTGSSRTRWCAAASGPQGGAGVLRRRARGRADRGHLDAGGAVRLPRRDGVVGLRHGLSLHPGAAAAVGACTGCARRARPPTHAERRGGRRWRCSGGAPGAGSVRAGRRLGQGHQRHAPHPLLVPTGA